MEKTAPDWIPKICTGLGLLRAILLSLIISALLVLLRYGMAGFDALVFGPLALLVLWLTLLCSFWLCLLHRLQRHFGDWSLALTALGGIGLIAALSTWLLNGWIASTFDQFELPLASVLENSLIALLLGLVILRFLAVHAQLQRRDQELSQARFDALQARIKPHFLFNTLNTIAALIDRQPQAAEGALLDLSDMLRSSIGRQRSDWKLGDELDLCVKYLGIEKLRMGERLDWRIQVEESLRQLEFPQLALQPLVENALLHGLQQLAPGGRLELQIERSGALLSIRLGNTAADQDQHHGTGQALANVRARLQAFSPRLQRFEHGREQDWYLVHIELELPQ